MQFAHLLMVSYTYFLLVSVIWDPVGSNVGLLSCLFFSVARANDSLDEIYVLSHRYL